MLSRPTCSTTCALLWLISSLSPIKSSVPIDNGVDGEPQISCGPGYIGATFLLRNSFDGHVYVKNHYNETQCRSDQTGKRTASLTVSFNTCGVQRTRSLNPRGIFVNTVIVITFHPRFITKVDRAYAFQCFYMESEKTVNAQLEISEITSVLQTQRVPMPVCRYEVLDAQPPQGQPIRYSIVGQQVFHRWTCDTETSNTFCMNVNSCFVYDGVGDQAQLLDSNGCAVDRYLLQNVEYLSDLTAVREAHVFKFADRQAIYFQCQIAITVKDPGFSCPRPACPTLPNGHSSSDAGDGAASGTAAGGIGTSPLPGSTPPGADGGGTIVPSRGTGGSSREAGTTPTLQGGGSTVVSGGGNRGTTQGLRPETPLSYAGTSLPPPPPPTFPPLTFTVTAGNQFRTTSNASYRAIGNDDSSRLDNKDVRRSLIFGERIRQQRSADQSQIASEQGQDPAGEELGVWDVRAPSIAVFDLDDSTADGLRTNRTHATANRQVSGGPGKCSTTLAPESEKSRDYCLALHTFALLLALAITPTCALILGCFVRYMRLGSRKLFEFI